MSGIAGYFGIAQKPEVLQGMVRKMSHRGGGEAFYLDNPVFIGIREVASGVDAQPVYSADERVAVFFSGTLGNAREICADLEQRGAILRSRQPAELLLHLYEYYGVGAVNQLRGAFVFAVHDKNKGLVLLARDRMGAAPLYYTTTPAGCLVFASEIKALLVHPGVSVVPDMFAIDAYLSLGYSPGEASMFKGIYKLKAGHRLIWNPGLHALVEPYWQWDNAILAGKIDAGEAEVEKMFADKLANAVRAQTPAEGTAGIVLTPAPEDSAIAAVMAAQTAQPVTALSVGYEGEGPESFAAVREVSRRLGMHLHETVCTGADMERLPEIVWALDEPVADPSILATYLSAHQARARVSTLFSGAGAESLMRALPEYRVMMNARRKSRAALALYRKAAPHFSPAWLARKFDPSSTLDIDSRERWMRFMAALSARAGRQQYACLRSIFETSEKQRMYAGRLTPTLDAFVDQRKEDPLARQFETMMTWQKEHALQDHVLMQAGKISMLSGITARAPFMDQEMVEFLLRVPGDMLFRAGKGNVLLDRHVQNVLPGVPSSARAKVPLVSLMSGRAMRELTAAALSEESVVRRGLLSWDYVRDLRIRAAEGGMLAARQVLALVMLELWFRIYVEHEKGWISG